LLIPFVCVSTVDPEFVLLEAELELVVPEVAPVLDPELDDPELDVAPVLDPELDDPVLDPEFEDPLDVGLVQLCHRPQESCKGNR